MSVAPTLRNLRIVLKRRHSGKSKVQAAWKLTKSVLKVMEKTEQHASHFRKIGACLHQLLNLRNEYLFSTPVRRCI